MTRNVGSIDRMVRVILGLALIILPFLGAGYGFWNWLSVIVGAVLLITGVARSCPLYSVIGVSTCPSR